MATYTNLNNEIFAQNALRAFVKTLAPLRAFSRNYSPSQSQKGDQVLVPLISALTATTFGGTYAICSGTKTVVTVNLNRHKHVAVGQDDITAWSSSEATLEDFGYHQGRALAQLVIEDVLTLVTTANFGSVTAVAAGSLDVPQLRLAKLTLDQANCPPDPRAALVDAVGMDALLAVTNFVQAYMFKDASVLQEGRVVRALAFDFYQLNSSFISGASVNAFIAHPDSIAIAMRYLAPQPGNTYSDARQVADPETGLVLGLRDHFDNNTGTRYINLECLYGFSAGITNGGRIIKRTD